MRSRRKIVLAAFAIALTAIAVTGGIVSSGNAARKATVKVALVTDTGSLNDKGFNTLAAAGLKRAEDKFGIDGRIYITQTAADRLPNLVAAAQAGYDLVIGNGVLFAFGPLPTAAKAFPKTMFVGVDVAQSDMGGAIPNVRGVQFSEQQAGCLVGNIAALEAKREGKKVVSAIGANPVAAIVRFAAGYKYCVQRLDHTLQVLFNYANDPTFNDQTKCKATADSQIARGTRVIFAVAGGCGLGALDAAKGAGIWGIGVDADQSFLGTHILTSARKRVDQAVFDTIKEFQANPSAFKGGIDKLYNLKNQGVGFGKISTALPQKSRLAFAKSTNALARLIIAGKVTPPTS